MRFLPRAVSLRTKILAIVLGAALIPLAVLGLWLNRGTEASGERLLRARLDDALVRLAADIGARWVRDRGTFLLIAEDDRVRRSLADADATPATELALPALATAPAGWQDQVQTLLVRDATGRPRWALARFDDAASPRLIAVTDTAWIADSSRDAITVMLPIYSEGASTVLGAVQVGLRTSHLVPGTAMVTAAAGAVVAVLDPVTGAALVPVPFGPAFLERDRFTWAGEEWVTSRRGLDEPPLTLLAAGQLAPFTAPFTRVARTGVWALLVMTVAAFLVTLVLTRRLTQSLELLATAADNVSQGKLEQRIEYEGADEVGRVAHAFNVMTESLRRTLRQLAERQAIAAVGEFASTLAHEVRNPLGAMRLNLQSIEERIGSDLQARSQMRQVLGDVDRLEATVAGALQVARSGRVTLERMDVRRPIELAMASAAPEFARRGAVLDPIECAAASTLVLGDGAALERVVLNLLLNAAQALEQGHHAGVTLEATDKSLTISVWDRGCGIPQGELVRVLEPFYTTKPEGTGLGLAIARQIVAAHVGEMTIQSEVGRGTTIRIELALAV